MKFNYFNKAHNKKAELLLFGEIGYVLSGFEIAQEFKRMNESYEKEEGEYPEEIIIRINSGGGNIFEGFSIVSAILNSNIPVTTINEGVAASMAGVIFSVGDKRYMRDYAKLMIHDPSLHGRSLEDMEEGKEKKALISLKESLSKILTENSELNKRQVDKKMTEETWIDAKEAKELGLCDKILRSKKKVKLSNNTALAVAEATNIYKQLNTNMDAVLKHLGLSNGSETDVINKVKAIETSLQLAEDKAEKFENELSGAKKELDAKDKLVTNLKTELAKYRKSSAENAVEAAIAAGKFKEDNRDKLVELANSDLDKFKELVDMVTVKSPKRLLDNEIKTTKGENKNERSEWTYEDWSKKDPKGLEEMQEKEPEKFENLLDEYTKDVE